MRNNYSYYYLLSQIYYNQISTGRPDYRLAEYISSDRHSSRYLIFSKIIYKATDSAIISANRTAAI